MNYGDFTFSCWRFQETQASRAHQAKLESRDQAERLEVLASQDRPDREESLESRDRQEKWACRVALAPEGLADLRENAEALENQDLKEDLDLPDLLDQL